MMALVLMAMFHDQGSSVGRDDAFNNRLGRERPREHVTLPGVDEQARRCRMARRSRSAYAVAFCTAGPVQEWPCSRAKIVGATENERAVVEKAAAGQVAVGIVVADLRGATGDIQAARNSAGSIVQHERAVAHNNAAVE